MFARWQKAAPFLKRLDRLDPSQRAIALSIGGSLALFGIAVLTATIGFTLPMAICVLLIAIVFLSLFANLLSSAIFALIAAGSLHYFFVPPLHTLGLGTAQDLMTFAAFLVSSIVIATLIRSFRRAQGAQAHLSDLSTYLAEAQKLSNTGSFGWDASSQRMDWSDETFRIFDVDRNVEPSLEVVLQRTHPDDVSLVRESFARVAYSGDDIDFEHRLLLPGGTIKHVRVVARAMSGVGGTKTFVGALMDVTAQKLAYADLQRSEQHYRHLFNLVPIALFQLDASALRALFTDLRNSGVTDLERYFEEHPDFLDTCMSALIYHDANERAVRLFGGRDASDFIGRSVGRGWKARPETFQHAMVSRFRGETTFEEETRMNTLDGRTIDVLFTTARLGQITETTTSVIGVLDITERVRAREQLQRLQADVAHAARVSVLGELTASIAHEVNQPLAAISTTGSATLRWLARPNPDIDGIRLRIERMMEDARRAADIIARIRAMATNATPERQLVSIDDVINDVLLFLRQEIKSRSTIVTYKVENDTPPILGDRTQLQQLVVNLCINAIQATQHSEGALRKIAITTALSREGAVFCTIEDSGPGILPDHLGQIFDSFFTTKEGGMGMGLAICRSIATSHGGAITVDNSSRFGGARFVITLPAAEAQAMSA